MPISAIISRVSKRHWPTSNASTKLPRGLHWRSSLAFVTFVVGFGITTDLLVYSIIVPVIPFQLQKLGYHDVSAHAAWLLFAYSLGLITFTFPVSWFSERYKSRKIPLTVGLVALMLFLVVLMEAPNFSTMFFARFMEGVSASCIWIPGLALICDTAPESKVGAQLGVAMMGLNIGLLIAPPVGGSLYARFGYHGPFVFAIVVAIFDMIGRLLIIERRDAMKWGLDPAGQLMSESNVEFERRDSAERKQDDEKSLSGGVLPVSPGVARQASIPAVTAHGALTRRSISTQRALIMMLRSPRIAASTWATIVYAITVSALEPTLPLRLQKLWGFDSSKVGLVYLFMAIPTVFMSYFSGWICDKFGTNIITFLCFLGASFLYVCLTNSVMWIFFLSLFIANTLLSGVSAPLSAEFASIKRTDNDIGYAHVYGAFNIAYGLGTLLGPIAAGQIYDHSDVGWKIVVWTIGGLLFMTALIVSFFVGERGVYQRWRHGNKRVSSEDKGKRGSDVI